MRLQPGHAAVAVALAVEKCSQLRGAEGAEQDILPVVLGLALQVPLPHSHYICSVQILWKLVQGIKYCNTEETFASISAP